MSDIEQYTERVVNNIRCKLKAAGLLPVRAQAAVANRILEDRLDNLLPELMEETGFDMWIVAGEETNEDPVMWTMVSPEVRYSRRQSALIFYRDPGDGHMERLSWMFGFGKMAELYKTVGTSSDTFAEVISRECERLQPEKIGIDTSSELGGFCGGLSAWMYLELVNKLPEKFKGRLTPAGQLSTRWLETMTDEECKVMDVITEVTEDIMHAFYSRELIKPGVTRQEDVKWFIKDVMARCELNFWFDPHIDLQRRGLKGGWYGPDASAAEGITYKDYLALPIEDGDLLHCDIGVNLKYIRVLTDRQWMCYMAKPGETDAPEGLKKAFKLGNRFQDLVCEGFRAGRTGNEVFHEGVDKAKAAGIEPMLYTHGLGVYGHNAGPIIGLIDFQTDIYPRGEQIVGYKSAHALELQHIAEVPEWDDQKVHIYLEEDVRILDKPYYFGHRQTELPVI